MEPDAQATDPSPRRSPSANTVIWALGGTLAVVTLGVLTHLLTTRSRDAVVDADFIELTSPISGELMNLKVDVGAAVRPSEPLAQVENIRASQADVRQLQTALTTAEANLAQVEEQLSQQRALVAEFRRNADDQRRLETARSSHELEQLRSDLARERKELAFSQRDVVRQEALFRAGAIAQNVVDRARTAAAENLDQVRGTEARIRAQTNRVEAAQRNLNLDRTRSEADPLPRLQEARMLQARLEGERAAAQRRVQGLKAQLEAAETLYQQQKRIWLKAPIAAVVWRLKARNGDSLKPQQPVMQLVNCASRWITTYISESDLKRLRIGSRARVDLIGENLDLRGKVDVIRSGVGRLSDDGNDPGGLPLNRARQSQVRVRIDSDVASPPRKLCFVGYSARVEFQ